MRIEISRDETDLIVDALHVFEQRLKRLGTRKSNAIGKMASGLANAIAEGKRTV
jgi:hypothetical protein